MLKPIRSISGTLQLCAAQTCSVIVDSKVAVGRRRRHQADMRRRRRQGQRSPLWPQSAAAWPPVPRSGTLECAALGSVQTFSTICHAYVHYTRATRPKGASAQARMQDSCILLTRAPQPSPKPTPHLREHPRTSPRSVAGPPLPVRLPKGRVLDFPPTGGYHSAPSNGTEVQYVHGRSTYQASRGACHTAGTARPVSQRHGSVLQ